MKNFRLLPVLAGLTVALMPFMSSWAGLPSNAEAEAILKKQLIDSGKAKGAAVALVDASGIRVVTVGVARDGVPLTADHLFEIGSVTKTFTALLLALAEEKGELKISDAVEKYLPDGIKLRDSNDAPIRLVDIATQRSGLPRLATNFSSPNPLNPYAYYTEANLLDFIRGFKATRARNAEYEYSNVGFGLLGYVLVRVAKAPSYEALLGARILKPLDMQNTTADPKLFVDRMAQPHIASGAETPLWDLPAAHAGAGAIRSTAGDMGRYAQAIAGLKPGVLSKAIALATEPREQGPQPINPIGLAFMQVPFHERKFINHDGGTMGSSSSLMVDPATHEGVFVVTNTSTRLFDIAINLLDRRYNLAPREFPKTVNVAPALLARYAGNYKLNDKMNVDIRVNKDGKIIAQATRQGEFEIFPESETRFFAKVSPIVMTFGDFTDNVEGSKAGSFVLEQGGAKTIARRIQP